MSKTPGPPADLSALSGLAPELAEVLVSVACDIALVLDDGGVIQTVAVGGAQPVASTAGSWIGQRWADTVTDDMRQKAEEFLDDLASTGSSRVRHLSHASTAGSEFPIAYTAVRLGEQGPTLAVGRDLRMVAAMQQRLVQAQQDLERDYWQRRQAETRYRLLFQVAAEPLLIVDAGTLEVVDANRAAAVLLGRAVDQLVGRPVNAAIEPAAHAALGELLGMARVSGRAYGGETRLAHGLGRIGVAVTPFQTDSEGVLLLQLRALPATDPVSELPGVEALADAVYAGLVRRTPDAVVIVDFEGRVTLANEAFRELVQFPAGQPIAGRELSQWIGDHEGAVGEILAMVRRDGGVRLLGSRLRHRQDSRIDIELSATLLMAPDCAGFIIRVSHQQASAGRVRGEGSDRDMH